MAFTLTDDAQVIVRSIASRTPGGRSVGGIRIADGSAMGSDFAIEVADAPVEGDIVVDFNGARVFLAVEVAEDLDGIALDASVNNQGLVDFALGSSGDRPEGMTQVRGTGKSTAKHGQDPAGHDHGGHDHDHAGHAHH